MSFDKHAVRNCERALYYALFALTTHRGPLLLIDAKFREMKQFDKLFNTLMFINHKLVTKISGASKEYISHPFDVLPAVSAIGKTITQEKSPRETHRTIKHNTLEAQHGKTS